MKPNFSLSTYSKFLSNTLIEINIDSVLTESLNYQSPPLVRLNSDHTSPPYSGPPLSPTSPLTDTIANTFVLGPNHPALQTPVTIENQLPLSPESVAVAIDRLADPESDFASDLASALGGINQLPGDYSSYQSSPACYNYPMNAACGFASKSVEQWLPDCTVVVNTKRMGFLLMKVII